MKYYYEILKVSETASPSEIKRAYYALCKLYHPDINPKTGDLFKEINTAYETLIDPFKRKEYDQKLKNPEPEEDYTEYTSTSYDDNESDTYTYYTNNKYYTDPSNDPIFSILDNFTSYRFENAVGALWERNMFVLAIASIFTGCIALGILTNRLIKKLFKKTIISKKYPKFKYAAMFYDGLRENTLGKFSTWSLGLGLLAFSKLICWVVKIAYKICKWALIIGIGLLAIFSFIGDGSGKRHR